MILVSKTRLFTLLFVSVAMTYQDIGILGDVAAGVGFDDTPEDISRVDVGGLCRCHRENGSNWFF